MENPDNLITSLGSFRLKNPFLLASGPPTASGENIRRAFDAGWAGAVIKTIHPDDMDIRDLSPRFCAWKGKSGELLGFENYELLSKHPASYWMSEIREIKSEYPEHLLIASIMGDTDPSSWQDLTKRVQQAGADAVELNMSCPHGMPEAGVGAAIGQNPSMVRELTRMVSSVADIPVYVKLTPNITDISPAARGAADGGADGISAINTIQCIMGVDIDTYSPLPSVCGYSTQGGYSGPAIKPVGLNMVSRIAHSVNLPIIGIGGITRWQDAVEYILLGASAIQVCTAVMWNGYDIIKAMNTGLSEYLAQKGFKSPDAIKGRSLPLLSLHQDMDRRSRIYPQVSREAECIQCGRCVTACTDGGYEALVMTSKGPAPDLERCDGCGLCILVCRSKALVATPVYQS